MKITLLETRCLSYRALILVTTIITGAALPLSAQTTNDAALELSHLSSSLRLYTDLGPEPAREGKLPRFTFAPGGYLHRFSAPPGHAFQPEQVIPDHPETTAQNLLEANKALLGLTSARADLLPFRTRQTALRTYVRLQQTYSGLPVFPAQAVVQLNANQGVEFVSADLSTEVNALDAQEDWVTALISAQQATEIVTELTTPAAGGAAFLTSSPNLMIFSPAVLGEAGPVRLVWEIKVNSAARPDLNKRWLLDAKTGEEVRSYELAHPALKREIRDANDDPDSAGALRREEGDPAVGLADVDDTYKFLGQTYNFYLSHFGRDSYDDKGAAIHATVRFCPSSTNCPWRNAMWTGSQIDFGVMCVADDVVAHELTHAVTESTSDLVYANASGAINESMSDIFGEFVDLSNGDGNDSTAVRWDVAEDWAFDGNGDGKPDGPIRSMSNPPALGDPDRLNSPLYRSAGGSDNGGVHSNSGVNNKLCYLLTDGDTFNGQTVTGMGIDAIADLYYEVNANLLTSGADWSDLYNALQRAAVNLGWTIEQRNNLERACRAVEINSAESFYVDGATMCLELGFPSCSWLGGPFKTVTLGVNVAKPGDNLFIRGGSYPESVTLQKITVVRSYDGPALIGK